MRNTKLRFASAILAGTFGFSSTAAAQAEGTFSAAANMSVPRLNHSATLLPDGRVLIAGGASSYTGPALASAELFDPSSGTFVPTGNMTTPRAGHSATLLPNGKVLIAGGVGGAGKYSRAEIFDPAAGTFAAIGNLVQQGDSTGSALNGPATLLNNGKVLILGAELQLYDPASGKLTSTGEVGDPFADTVTSLGNGLALITRFDPDLDPVGRAKLYAPFTNTIVFAGDMSVGHSGPTATLLLNGKVLIAGGDDGAGDGGETVAELYDPAAYTFTQTGNLFTGLEQHTATLLSDGTVLLTGGHWDLTTAEIYDPGNGTFHYIGDMLTGREAFRMTLLNDGRLLITGGSTYYPTADIANQHSATSTAEFYKPTKLTPVPVLLSLSGDGKGQGAILHGGTSQVVSADNPAIPGEVLEIYCTGLVDGAAIPPQVAIGGVAAQVSFFGSAPGYPGLNQVNVNVPDGILPGPSVPVRFSYVGRSTNTVTIGVGSSEQ